MLMSYWRCQSPDLKIWLISGTSESFVHMTTPNDRVAQAILSRSNKFDASLFPILTVEDLVAQVKPAKLWLNIQHDIFYRQLNLDMRRQWNLLR
ncbi:hypothetical protein MUK42_15686 [Musa troglodytarum]|uniref:glycerophosphodiester phosphodiesterase n=1 Tax=Musa troglodytarum TaxID=320322 RepID=A0A9E7H5R2_9LILI|nr:hypothetical protein MUK42_15686 [Musa troglodytarum]